MHDRARQDFGLLTVVAVIGAAILAGYTLGARPHGAPADPVAAQPIQAADTQIAPSAGGAERPDAGPAQAWQLIGETRDAAGGDTGRQSQLLEDRLSRLPGQQILDFARERRKLDERAYNWDLWGAAYVIEDGCSDDCFRDFRAYLISLGRGPYQAALRDPDSLAPIVKDAEEGDWENADDVAPDAYQSATGNDYPLDDSDLSGDPAGEPWDDEDQEALVQLYPALAARFR